MGPKVQYVVVYDGERALDRDHGEWLVDVLMASERTVRRWDVAGAQPVVEIDDAIEAGARMLLVVGAGPPLTDTVAGGAARAAFGQDPGSRRRSLLPVLFDGALTGMLASITAIDLRHASGEAAQELVLAGVREAEGLDGREPSPAGPVIQNGRVPRLRMLSETAIQDAGLVDGRPFLRIDHERPGIYVRRDVEHDVLARLRAPDAVPVLISGPGGTGKTSLLWGLARSLLENDARDVYFVKAAWLSDRNGEPLVDVAELSFAVDAGTQSGRAVTVLVDTADLLVGDDRGLLALLQTARMSGASVAITSRPHEADHIEGQLTRRDSEAGRRPAPSIRVRLDDFATEADSPGQASEFERAVAAHALEYCNVPGDTSQLARQMLDSVVRAHQLGTLARHPLTLRMLFDLYAPRTVPPTVDATDLFDGYWEQRVRRDRRSWAMGPDDPSLTVDCRPAAESLALHMLRTGLPEVAVRDVPADEPGALAAQVSLLVARGVGHVDAQRVFSFFHQTFFEYAAAQALLHRAGNTAIAVLLARTSSRPADFFLRSVLEQTWVCAWRSGSHRSTAWRETAELLAARLRDETTVPDNLLRPALLAAAQVQGSWAQLRPEIDAVLALPGTHVSLLRDTLALLPRPGRPMSDDDIALLRVCSGRDDPTWFAVLGVLGRMVDEQPDRAVRALSVLTLSRKLAGATSEQLATAVQLPTLLAGLLAEDPDLVLTELSKLGATGKSAGNKGFVALILELLTRAPADFAGRLSAWTDDLVGQAEPTGRLVLAHAALHLRDAERRLAASSAVDVLGDVERAVHRIAAAAPGDDIEAKATSADRARFGGAVMALGGGDDVALAALAAWLPGQEAAAVHAELHRGWLLPGLSSGGGALRAFAVRMLVDGLPAPHQKPGTPRERWADTIRRSLERPELADPYVVEIADAVVADGAPSETSAWLDPDRLLRIVLRCRAAGSVSATVALDHADWTSLAPEAWNLLRQQAKDGGQIDGLDDVVRACLARGLLVDLEKLLQARSDLDVPADIRQDFGDAVRQAIGSDREKVRRAAARLLAMTRPGVLVPIAEFDTLVRWFERSPDPVVRMGLVTRARDGAERGDHDVHQVLGWLRGLLTGVGSAALVGAPPDLEEARKALVSLAAACAPEPDPIELLSWAFKPPVTADVVSSLAGWLKRPGDGHVPEKVEVLVEVGRRLADPAIGSRVRKDVPGRWRRMVDRLLVASGEQGQVRLLSVLGELDPVLAACVVDGLRPGLYPAVRGLMESLAADPAVDHVVRRRLGFALEEPPTDDALSAAWWALDEDLSGTRSAVKRPQD